MGRMVRNCLQSVLKLVNSVIGLAGMGMILYSLWMIRVWFKQSGGSGSSPPWYAFHLTFFLLILSRIFGLNLVLMCCPAKVEI
jgi:hypothetical protein